MDYIRPIDVFSRLFSSLTLHHQLEINRGSIATSLYHDDARFGGACDPWVNGTGCGEHSDALLRRR
jgi:hypothetical protein